MDGFLWFWLCVFCCSNTKIVLTTGLASDEVFRIGEVSCHLPEALVYLMNQKGRYENIYGIEMWQHALGEMTMEEVCRDIAAFMNGKLEEEKQ